MRILGLILKISKYLLILTFIILIAIVVIFFKYSKRLDYKMPEKHTITILDKDNDYFFEINNANKQTYININNIDQDIINAFISIEDKDFYTHKGINIKRIGGAIISNIKSNSFSQGASTITQQLARNLFLSNEKTYKRKIEEISIAISLETRYSKDEILEGYLNTIYFGHGVYGIQDACQFFFKKDASNVTLAEACVIAAIPKGPALYSPVNNYENNKARKELIINELYNDEKITFEQKNNALIEKINIVAKKNTSSEVSPFYQDLIIEELKRLNIDSKVSYTVYTNLDKDLHHIITESIEKYKQTDNELEVAVFAMDPKTGNVLDVIGGNDYQTSTFNRATKSLRQPGSTIKPFLYYSALENGFTPITTFNSSKTSFNINGNVYEPNNYKDIYPNQDVTMAYALATSDNIYAVKTHLFLGTDVLYNTLLNFGFTSKINNNPSLALGTSEVSLSELVTGYAKIASMGKDIKPIYINKIVDANGKLLFENNNENFQKYDSSTCYILTETMTNMFDNNLSLNISVTGAALKTMLSQKYAGKSGSTNTDNWMIGYNNNLLVGVWCGYDDNRVIENGQGTFIKYIWAEIMEKYTSKLDNNWYQTPFDVTSIVLNPINGQLAINNEYSKKLFFKINNIPWYIFEKNEIKINEE